MNDKESWVGTQQRGHETGTLRRCSAFRITEGGVIEHFRVDGVGGLLSAAGYVRIYQQEKGTFAEKMHGREQILTRWRFPASHLLVRIQRFSTSTAIKGNSLRSVSSPDG